MKKRAPSLRSYMPDPARLKAQGPLLVLGLLGLGLVLGVILSLVPALKTLDQEVLALADAEQQVIDAQAIKLSQQRTLSKQLELVRSNTLSKTALLLSKAQASSMLDQLYQLAASTGVRIITLQNQPSPEAEKGGSVDITRFRLHVAGSVPDLLRFVALTKQTISTQAFLLSNVNISQGPQSAALLMDLVLFTSSGVTPPEQADPLAATQPVTVTAPIAQVTPSPTATPGISPLLVKPKNWPTGWPWPPKSATVLPMPTAGSAQTTYSTYLVQPGDSLSTIASRYHTTVEALMAANGLVDYTIYVNQKLLVPVQ
jgi:hypothetical protein